MNLEILLLMLILIQTVGIFTTVLIIDSKASRIKEMFEEVLRSIH